MGLKEEPNDRRRKRNIQIAFSVFIGVLVLFTLFSNTLQSLTLPKVKTEKLVIGSLVHTLEGSGVLRPLAEVKLSNPAGWKIKKILVKEGEIVKKGQKLIIYDSQTAESELQDEVASLEKQKINLLGMQDRFVLSTAEGDESKIRSASRDIATLKLDLGMQERKINERRERLVIQKELSAPFDGRITKLNAVEGLASMGEPDVLISNDSRGYRFEFLADSLMLSNFGISIAAKIKVETNARLDQPSKIIEGTIAELVDAEPRLESLSNQEAKKTVAIAQKLVRVTVVSSELEGGEQAFVKLTNRSQQEGRRVSNVAIHQDREGKYIYKIDEQRGALGNVFVARKASIQVIETNEIESMIQVDNVNEDDLIILESSEPLQDSNRIRLQ
ncbi:biotin/lipoyl-binding protein [Paenibacillus sp. SYP-B3998]|uniref:Biotin/lipoyl-binding protein n=1 Tax=Paenibacillus sp. SYP-B3998 TaxID=2678564 RepID=A0A6G3ZU28_9BACL|nr:biotin/lipoyl-binding protein [Paenibacillus sp. SYP-B3998]NEW05713.1 biotin/lipoyl-binding protein [Paenibacillus sp. SYP-B3998]